MNLNPLETNQNPANFDPGQEVFAWTVQDYHPYQRGIIWYTVFCSVLFGGAIWSMISDPKWGWLMALSFFLAAAVYFYAHRKGEESHKIHVFERGLFIDNKFFPTENFAGFWMIYDETAAIINLKFKSKRRNHKISLQMGKQLPEFFRDNFTKVNLLELEDERENLLDLWIRALKL